MKYCFKLESCNLKLYYRYMIYSGDEVLDYLYDIETNEIVDVSLLDNGY